MKFNRNMGCIEIKGGNPAGGTENSLIETWDVLKSCAGPVNFQRSRRFNRNMGCIEINT